jgi:5'-methylthioadenosine phosphorylase
MASDVEIVLRTLPRIHFACRARGVRDRLRDAMVSEHQARILALLDVEDPAMVSEVAEAMGVTASTMSLNLTRLERSGLVARERDPADRRVMNVRLTLSGAALLEELSELDVGRVDALLRTLGREERPSVLAGLIRLADAADALIAKRGAPEAAGGSPGALD